MHHPTALILLVGATPQLGVAAGVVGALLWRRRAIRRGHRVTALRSIIGVGNGVAVGLVGGVVVYLLLSVALPPPA